MSFLFHPEMIYFLPVCNLGEMVCECCGEDAGCALDIGWLAWSLMLHFGGEAHP